MPTHHTANYDASDIIGELRPSKALQEEFGEKLSQLYKINGRQLREWRAHFSVDIPLDPSLKQVKEFLVKISNLHQEAVFLKTDTQLRHSLLLSTRNRKYNDAYIIILNKYKQEGKQPISSSALMTYMTSAKKEAEIDVAQLDEALAHADTACSFFKNILTSLVHHKSVLESIVMDLGIEAKLLKSSGG